MLELQTQQARNQLISRSGAQGGALDRNLAAIEAQRVYGLGEQEARRTNAQRQLAGQMFGQATEQGITAPQQQAALAGQASGIFGSVEQQRQAGLTGALGAVESAAARELEGRNFQQQALIQSQQLAQQYGAQLAEGADVLRLAAPEQLGQATALYNQQWMAPNSGASVLGQAPVESSAAYLGPVASGQAGILGSYLGADTAANAAASAERIAAGQRASAERINAQQAASNQAIAANEAAAAAKQAKANQKSSTLAAAGSAIATVGAAALIAFT